MRCWRGFFCATVGRQNSGTRFAVWFSALLGIAVLPLLGHFTSGAEIATQSEFTMPASWALYIFSGWLLIATAGLVRIGVGFWRLRQLRKSCTPIDPEALDPLLRKTLQEFKSSRSVVVCVSDRLGVPTALGFMKPMVVIPSWTVQELSAAELNSILLHELAHLRRWDDWTNLLQKILGALLFFHPAIWWIEKKLALEREMACDDLVLVQAANPHAYAECLVALAEKSLFRRGLALAQAAVGRVRHMSLRVAQILDEKRPEATRVWSPAPLLLTAMSLAGLLMFSNAPQLVSFENGATISSAPTPVAAAASNRADAISMMASSVVPAKFVLGPETKSLMNVPARRKTEPAHLAVTAKSIQRQTKLPFVRAGFAEGAIAPQTVILVMQSAQYDASGSVVWNLCVWQVTVMGPAGNQGQAGAVSKSI